MTFEKIETRRIVLGLMVSLFCLFSACGGGDTPSRNSGSATGGLRFSVVYHGAGNSRVQEAVIDCAGEGIATVEAAVYSSEGALLARGGPWQCETGQGTISSVPAGSGRILVILGKSDEENVIFRGQQSDIKVNADQENDAGIIACYSFAPNLQAPSDGAVVNADAMGLSWSDVAGATEYHVIVSASSELSDPIIDTMTIARNYSPTGLSNATTYFWQVTAGDAYKNRGIGSQIQSFTVDTEHTNIPPQAQVTRPADDSIFTTADVIVFVGNGRDAEDGELSGSSLVWHSDRDGTIGHGASFSSNTLSAGIHQIALTATDSDGATGTDTVMILVATGRLPDTGQMISYTETFGEDSDYLIHMPDFTKLDADGRDLGSSATDWAMVRDNITGLIWEVKTDDGGVHDKDTTFTWHAAQDNFFAQLNADNFGGYSDWRLPTTKELAMLMHKDKSRPAIDTNFFPYTMSDTYWSSTEFFQNSSERAWAVYFSNGYVLGQEKDVPFFARAVRGDENHANLVDNGDGTVTDLATGFSIEGCVIEQHDTFFASSKNIGGFPIFIQGHNNGLVLQVFITGKFGTAFNIEPTCV
jgi:hypothetical protein